MNGSTLAPAAAGRPSTVVFNSAAGPVVTQHAVDVLAGDTVETLAQRVRAAERALVVETLAAIAAGRIKLPA